ncbi:hypothetical protein TRM7557_03406 [Tritonibacter multivorans]|uniref:Uncharacterized protein n=1 Tax=Tritonibacter multivorans TaxID=928856 RepID=A0A0N7M0U0_9RHOB|nr:hypothetical protein [Tritonibacter multivorans]MDA7420536.1 hypothetical protein [Tritonibacter multivorans]CUH81401.1 hypothetical protein TRM7557_03406 [Tritonibacter multivorans]SFC34783.1 hypothetical protein SAMN04488049_102242 [Tritonibacter multivorans]
MEYLIWAGGALTLAGMVGLVFCVLRVVRAKRQNLDDEALRAVLQGVLPMNLGALALSVLGLMLVMVGLVLA